MGKKKAKKSLRILFFLRIKISYLFSTFVDVSIRYSEYCRMFIDIAHIYKHCENIIYHNTLGKNIFSPVFSVESIKYRHYHGNVDNVMVFSCL